MASDLSHATFCFSTRLFVWRFVLTKKTFLETVIETFSPSKDDYASERDNTVAGLLAA